MVRQANLNERGRSAESNADARTVFERMRAKVEASNAEEPTMEEINAFIAAVRGERLRKRR